jgi:hypothetical protein
MIIASASLFYFATKKPITHKRKPSKALEARKQLKLELSDSSEVSFSFGDDTDSPVKNIKKARKNHGNDPKPAEWNEMDLIQDLIILGDIQPDPNTNNEALTFSDFLRVSHVINKHVAIRSNQTKKQARLQRRQLLKQGDEEAYR